MLHSSAQKNSGAASLQLRARAEAERRRRGIAATPPLDDVPAPELRGAAKELARALLEHGTSGEYMVAGPAETGKTYAATHVLDMLLRTYPGAQGVMVRKVRDTIKSTCGQTYEKIVDARGGVHAYGGNDPQWYDYSNGSRLWLAGMDKPGKALSSERDFIYINQGEELEYSDYQTLTTRATGRAANAPMHAVFGDCNPGPAHHWIKHRAPLRLLESRHEDNPTLYTAAGELTPRGVETMRVLNALEGVLLERLRYGRWVSSEGAVYQFDARLHLVKPFYIPPHWRRIRCIDFGFTNPFVCLWVAIDGDGRMIVYRQLYTTGALVEDLAGEIVRHTGPERIEATIADPEDPEGRATLARYGVPTIAAHKALGAGIQAVKKRLAPAGDRRPRLVVVEGSLVERDEELAKKRQPVDLVQEFDAYVYPKGNDGKPQKEEPIDNYNHALDALRYGVAYVDRLGVATGGARGSSNYLLEGGDDDE